MNEEPTEHHVGEVLEPEPGFMGQTMVDLTSQERRFVLLRCSGMSMRQAAQGAGYHPMTYGELMKRPQIIRALEEFKTQLQEHVVFGITEAHAMLMEAWANAANSTEQRLVVEALMKLHKLVEPQGKGGGRSVTININKLDQLSDDKLLEMAGKTAGYLDLDDD